MSPLNPLLKAEVVIEVPFHDLDPMQIVWHGRYAQYFEIARCALLEQIDYSYDSMRASGYSWPVIDMRIQYVRPARFRQKLKVMATLSEYRQRLKIRYEIRDLESNERITKGYTCQVAVSSEDGRMLMSSPASAVRKIAPLFQ